MDEQHPAAGTIPRPARGRPRRAANGARRFKAVMVALEPSMVADLDAAVRAEGLDSRSELVRRACASYLRRAQKRLGERPAANEAVSGEAT